MLTCILKADGEIDAICSIPKFVDRIQISKKSNDTQILRYFVVENHADSPIPIHEISLIVPHTSNRIQSLQNRTYQMLDLNDPFIKAAAVERIDRERRIIRDYDGLGETYIFSEINHHLEAIGECTRIRLFFDCPLVPGRKAAIRMRYTVKNRLRKLRGSTREFRLGYFHSEFKMTDVTKTVCTVGRQIPALMWYGRDRPADNIRAKGGIDIFLRCPFDYQLTTNPPCSAESVLRWNNDGIADKEEKIYLWRLRHLRPKDDPTVICNENVELSSIIEKPITRWTQWKFFLLGLLGAAAISILTAYLFHKYWGK